MNKQSITFKADEQELIKTGGINSYASNIVAYIEATFELGENWAGYDSVRAVWSNDYLTDISTVLDPNGRCIVPTEVLTDTGNVTVNLVGSISVDDELTDRLTTYPCKALTVDADAKVEGDETESITPSQFEQFVEIVHDEVEQVTGMTAEAETLPAGSDATASYSDGVLSLGIPQGIQGEQGEQGETGHTGAPAGFGDVTASVDNTVGTPSVNVHTSGPDTAKEFDFEFHNLKGDKGDTGDTGATGNGIASTVLNPDYTLTITFTDGTSYTTPSIRGAKGDTGDTGATGNGIQSTVLNADYTLTITFTDGTSYTTPSIRGEQGPAGPVSDVTVNGTSVVDQNGVAVITMPELVKTVQGNPIVIDDAFGEVKNLDVELLPIQDLHGYSKPWSGGAGKNKFPVAEWYTAYNVSANNLLVGDTSIFLPAGTYTVSFDYYTEGMTTNVSFWRIYSEQVTYCDTTKQIGYGGMSLTMPSTWTSHTVTFTTSQDGWFAMDNGQLRGGVHYRNIMLETGSTATTYEPYSNICPITGHDSVTVTDTDGGSQSQSKTVTLPHTCYGAGVGVTSGEGKEKIAYLKLNTADMNGAYEDYPTWSGVGVRNIVGTGINGAVQAIITNVSPANVSAVLVNTTGSNDMLILNKAYFNMRQTEWKALAMDIEFAIQYATPTDLSTTPTDITLYNGDNVISSDGDMELTYVQDMAIVIEKLENLL